MLSCDKVEPDVELGAGEGHAFAGCREEEGLGMRDGRRADDLSGVAGGAALLELCSEPRLAAEEVDADSADARAGVAGVDGTGKCSVRKGVGSEDGEAADKEAEEELDKEELLADSEEAGEAVELFRLALSVELERKGVG